MRRLFIFWGVVVRLAELRINDFRIIEEAEISLSPRWNVFVGANGAGKTSVLEAAFLLSHGRSFRRGLRDTLSRMGSAGFSIFGRIQRAGVNEHRLGLMRVGGKLESRCDTQSVGIADLVQRCAVICFEPGSHELISGVAEERRRYLDWGVFHVEHAFLSQWRRYQRALRQRNACLREGGSDAYLEPWEVEMISTGQTIAGYRDEYVGRLRPVLLELLEKFLGELGCAEISLDQGWKEGQSLADALAENRQRDRERGHTARGPHRADWSIAFERAPKREHLSRGQEKLCAIALILAQARLFASETGEWPVLCLDDLASELDPDHQADVLSELVSGGAQVLLTGTELPQVIDPSMNEVRVFHVEQGRISS
ncbi:MAG: DNA replication/repair protein RecF [Dokdonella sp.]